MHVVLVAPEIAPNTGTIARLCAATNAHLHLVRPLGFRLDDKHMKRAGLDYWQHVRMTLHNSLADFFNHFAPEECWFATTKSTCVYTDVSFTDDAVLVFGNEGHGLPASVLAAYPARTVTIPMNGAVRSINVATAVAAILFETTRQLRKNANLSLKS